MTALRVQQVFDLPPGFDSLVLQSQAEGFHFLRRMRDDWTARTNCFAAPGEALFAGFDATVVGVCGLNVDPYANSPQTGRIRHLYVSPAHRRRGIARALLSAVITQARQSFAVLRLRTNSAEAAHFYEAHDFIQAQQEHATHVRHLF